MTLQDLTPILQLSISPVILISGIGLLLLSMTNRYGRVIDRVRSICDTSAPVRERQTQIAVLRQRSRLLRAAIGLAVLSLLLAACLIIGLFTLHLFGLDAWAAVPALLFVACALALIGSLLLFLMDVNLSLRALDVLMDKEP